MNKFLKSGGLLLIVSLFFMTSCKKEERSATTGWVYNDPEWGGYEKDVDYQGQATGPNLVLIEGGTFNMGMTEQDVMMDWTNIPRRVTVSSFYMDETEVSNDAYREYLFWLNRVFSESFPEVLNKALPDTLVWREELAFNEPFVETYLRHPSYTDYPVVGINWSQANEYAKWRTDRTNEMILIEKGILNPNAEQKDEDNFNTEAYLVGQYEGNVRKAYEGNIKKGEGRRVNFSDGILLPSYRLPTEAEWEYAALALQGNQSYEKDEKITDRRLYPWDGNTMRMRERGRDQGKMLANYKRGKGDYMGMAGKLNDNAHITAPVDAGYPNDFGLYNMAGNVSEWTLDVYRPLTPTSLTDVENHDLNSFRGNVFMEKVLDEDGRVVEKDSIGRIRYQQVKDEDVAHRENYKKGNVLDYLDGDKDSEVTYNYGKTTLISDKSRVIKGGSWADRAYWLSPGARRFKQEEQADRTVGFRCAMTRTGAPEQSGKKGGNHFRIKKKPVKRSYK